MTTYSIDQSNSFEALFNNASMGIVVMNSRGAIQAVNPFALKIFGYNMDEIINRPIETLIPPSYHQQHVVHRQSFVEQPNNRPMGAGMDLYAMKKDHTEFPVEISLGNYKNDGGDFVIAFISDITVRKKAEAEIEKLNNRLESTVQQRTRDLNQTLQQLEIALERERELGELKSRFVSMASHEFRTPLSTILSSAYLVEKYANTEDQPKREKHLQRIISSVSMLTDTLNELLSIGKIEEGKIQVKAEWFNIEQMMLSLLEEIKNTLKRHQEVHYRHEGNCEVLMDVSMLKHIILNLISNASKFSAEAMPILIKTSNKNNRLVLSVKDHGIGIPPEDQKHLMERFFRGRNVMNIQGTGLGLHIISKYAELLNGTINCRSELEKGTEFILTFNITSNQYEKDLAY